MHTLLALALLLPQATATDTLQVRSGLYAGFGLGPAHLNYQCDGCPEAGAAFATHAVVRVGTVVSPHFSVGVDLDFWRRQGNTDGAITPRLTATWYPALASGGFLTAGVGISQFHGVGYADGPTERGSGPGAAIGVGYDLRIDRELSLTPALSLSYSDFGTTYVVGLPERRGTSVWLLAFAIGLTWH
ncbi:MAG: outer membrane beta-barrel protein [Gemmatimonadales bacterium]